MNAPLPTNPPLLISTGPDPEILPLSKAAHVLAPEVDLCAVIDGPEPAKASASELLHSFTQNLKTDDKTASLGELVEWLRERGWPEGRSEMTDQAGRKVRLSIYMGHDGYATKQTPYVAREVGEPGFRPESEAAVYTIHTRISQQATLGAP